MTIYKLNIDKVIGFNSETRDFLMKVVLKFT